MSQIQTRYCYENGQLHIYDGRIPFRPNFSGRPTKFNSAGGKMEFCVVIDDPEIAQQLSEDGWNVKIRVPRTEDEPPMHYLKVNVKYTERSHPVVKVVTQKRIMEWDEGKLSQLDNARISKVDLSIRPYHWTNTKGESGIAGYLTLMYATIEEDRFAERYEYLMSPDEEDEGEPPF